MDERQTAEKILQYIGGKAGTLGRLPAILDFRESGGNINQWNYWGGQCQKWILEPAG